MSETEYISPIVEALRTNRLVVFLGPFFSLANGYPDLRKWLEQILLEHFPNDTQKQRWLNNGQLHRVAEGYAQLLAKDPQKRSFEEMLSSEFRFRHRPEPLYRLAAGLPARFMVTACLDTVLDELLPFRSFCLSRNEDAESALLALQEGKRHLVHAMGNAEEPDSLIFTYSRFKESLERKSWKTYFESLFLEHVPLFVGFDADDFFIGSLILLASERGQDTSSWWLFNHHAKTDRIFHSLCLIPSEPFFSMEKEEHNRLSAVDVARSTIQEFLGQLVEASRKLSRSLFAQLEPRGEPSWNELTEEIIEKDVVRDPDEFYRGREIGWSEIKAGLDAPRNLALEIKERLRIQRLQIGLLVAPSGLGKTTLAKRVAYELWETERFVVFWVRDVHRFPEDLLDRLDRLKHRDVLVVVDRAENLTDLPSRLHQWRVKRFQRLRLLFVGRIHEIRKNVMPISWLRRQREYWEFNLGPITRTEAQGFIKRLSEHNLLKGSMRGSLAEETERFLNSARGDLLATLLTCISGSDLGRIVGDVCQSVLAWPDGRILLNAYAVAAVIELAGEKCTKTLFARMLGSTDINEVFNRLLNRLPGELELEYHGDAIETRHKLIAEKVCEHLFNSEYGLFDAVFICENILNWVGEIGQMPELKLNTAIPRYFLQNGDTDSARTLFMAATSASPKHVAAWQAWGVMERNAANFKEAERLFRTALYIDPKNAPSSQAWAIMEKDLENFDKARELFDKATKADSRHAPAWQAWAIMEKDLENFDKARELFEKATKADSRHAPSWQAWALMEKELKNFEWARDLFENGTSADPRNAPSWQAWAIMEKDLGDFDKARELFEKAIKADPRHAPSWHAFIQMEEDLGQREAAANIEMRASELGISRDELKVKAHTGTRSTNRSKVKTHTGKRAESDNWPFTPKYITHRLTFGQFRKITYLLGGLSLRLKEPVVLVEFPLDMAVPIYPVEKLYEYPPFCTAFLGHQNLQTWEEHPCVKDVKQRAQEIIQGYRNNAFSDKLPVIRCCWAGFRSLYYPMRMDGRILGLFIVGKFDPTSERKENLREVRLESLEAARCHWPDYEEVSCCLAKAERTLRDLGEQGETTEFYTDEHLYYYFEEPIRRGLRRVEESIASMHRERRARLENDFSASLHAELALALKQNVPSVRLQEILGSALERFRHYLGADYAGLFLGYKPEDRYLQLVVLTGEHYSWDLRPDITLDRQAAEIPPDVLNEYGWDFRRYEQNFRETALLGTDREMMAKPFLAVPFSHLGRIGVLCVGPLRHQVGGRDLDALKGICFRLGLELADRYLSSFQQHQVDRDLLGLSLYLHSLKHESHTNLAILDVIKRIINREVDSSSPDMIRVFQGFTELETSIKRFKNNIKTGMKNARLAGLVHADRVKGASDWAFFTDFPCRLSAVLANVVENYTAVVQKQNMSIKISPEPSPNISVRIDPQFLYEVANCLVDNAVKYGKPGGSIIVTWFEQQGQITRIVVSGPGARIPTEMRERIFDKGFSLGNHEFSLGWGLTLVKEVAEKCGGQAGLDSRELSPPDESFQEHDFWFTLAIYGKEVTQS